MRVTNRLLLCVATSLVIPCLLVAQSQPKQPPPERKAIISFVGPIDNGSVNNLLHVVTDEIRGGTKKITILLSSSGGDTAVAFAAYNILKNVPVEITTFNVGNVDSAALLLYCSGRNRFSLPGTRFIIHGNSMFFPAGVPVDSAFINAQLLQLKKMNQMVIQVISDTSHKKRAEVETALRLQQILSPEQAKDWGIVQEIKSNFLEDGSVMISTVAPDSQPKEKGIEEKGIVNYLKITSITPSVTSAAH